MAQIHAILFGYFFFIPLSPPPQLSNCLIFKFSKFSKLPNCHTLSAAVKGAILLAGTAGVSFLSVGTTASIFSIFTAFTSSKEKKKEKKS